MTTLSDYNNNPGNLRPPKGITYDGQIGVDDQGFAIFENKKFGQKALVNDLSYKLRHGVNTPDKFVDKYAPAGKENSEESRENYKIYLAQQFGLKSTSDAFPEDGADKLATAVSAFEGGAWNKPAEKDAKTEEPTKTEEAKVPDLPSEGKPLAKVAEGKEQPKKRELSVPMSALAGAGLGAGAGTSYATLKAKIDAFNQLQEALSRRSEPIFGETPARPASSTGRIEPTLGEAKTPGGQNWTKSLTGVDVPHAQMNKQSLDIGKQLAEAVGPKGGPFAGGEIRGGIILGPEIGAKTPPPPPEPKPAPAKPSSRFPTAARYAGALLKYPVGGALAGLGAGATAADVYNRYYGGDKTGATISGLGGLAGLASMFVPSMGALPAAAGAAPLYLMASDRLKRLQKHPEEYKLYESMFDPMGNYTGP